MRALTFRLLRLHYRRAERAIKRCARLSYAVPTPAINQLRYAGYHVLCAVEAQDAGNTNGILRHLEDAEEHCVRAWLDAFDAITCRNLLTIRAFDEKCYPISQIERYIPGYIAEMEHARRMYSVYRNSKLVQEMTVRERVKMLHDHRRISSFVGELQRLDRAFLGALEKLAERKEARMAFGRFVSSATSLVTSVFGFLLSAAGLVAVDDAAHPWIVVLGKVGIVVFTILLLLNATLSIATVTMRRKDSKARPRWNA